MLKQAIFIHKGESGKILFYTVHALYKHESYGIYTILNHFHLTAPLTMSTEAIKLPAKTL